MVGDPFLLDLSRLNDRATGDGNDGKVGVDSSGNGDEEEAVEPGGFCTASIARRHTVKCPSPWPDERRSEVSR
jgi:hypothetical protein